MSAVPGSSPRALSSAPASTLTGRGARNWALASRATTSGGPGDASWAASAAAKRPSATPTRQQPAQSPAAPFPRDIPATTASTVAATLAARAASPPEIAGWPTSAEGEPARTEHLYTGSERFHGGQGRLPAADLGRHVPSHHLEVGATALHLPSAHARPGTGGPGGR